MLHDEVVSRLRHILMEGEIAPGARIPERELCASLAISRTPLREALKVLAAEGLVVLLPNRGSRAAKLTQKDVKELFEVCSPPCRPTWSSIIAPAICCRIIVAID